MHSYDPFLDKDIPDMKLGDVLYECQSGFNLEFKVVSEPVEGEGVDGRRCWSWVGENTQNNDKIDYLLTEGLSHYGPRLYRSPQYCRIIDGEMVFELLGSTNE